MRTETDALLSLQRYVAEVLPEMTEVLTELERGDPPDRPFAVASSDDEMSTGGLQATPWPVLPVTVHVYIEGSSRKDARRQSEDVREALWYAFNVGVGLGRPMYVPLFDYTGKPAAQRVELLNAARGGSGTFTLAIGAQVSDPLPREAQPRDLRLALEELIGPGIVAAGRAGGPWTLRFDGAHRGQPVATLVGDASNLDAAAADPPAVAVGVESIGSPDPWRAPRDFARVEGLHLGGLPDPSNPTLRTITAGLRLTWARGGRVPSAEMTLTGIDLRGMGA